MRRRLCDFHNQAATTYYYPSSRGIEAANGLNSQRTLLDISGAGGVTYTVEWTADDAANQGDQLTADVWRDVTGSCVNLITGGAKTATSWVDSIATLDLSHLPAGRWRLKCVTSDATNDGRATLMIGAGTPGGVTVTGSSALPAGAATEARQTSDHCTSVAAKTAPATPAAAEAIAASTACHTGVLIAASESNGNIVYIGGSGVTVATGIPMSAGDTLFLPVTDAALVFCVGGAAAQVVKAVVL